MKKPSILLGIGLSFALASCTPGGVPGLTDSTEGEQPSQSEDKTDNPTSSKPDKESDLKYDQAGNPIFENVEIDFWSISIGSDGLIQKEIVDAFNEEYEGKIHVNRAERRHDEFSSAIVNTVVNDPENAPDIVQGHGERIRELQSQGIYVPLEEAIELSKIDYQRSNYFENILDDLYLEDDSGSEHLYGFPLDMHSNVIIARKDIIEKNGYEVPTNHQEFIEVCQGLADKAYAGTYQYLPTAQTNPDLEWMTSSAGTELYPWFMSIEALDDALTYAITGAVQNGSKMVDERGLPAWNTQSTIDYFEQMREYMYPSDGKRPLIRRSLSYEFISDFYKGNYIFASTGPWNLTGYKTIFDSAIGLGQGGFEEGVAIMPISNLFALDENSEDASKIVGTAHAFSLTRTVESDTVKAACMVFADYMSKQYVKWMEGGHLPMLKSAMEDPALLESDIYKNIGQYLGNPEDFTLGGVTEYYSEVFGLEMNQGLNEVWHQTFNTQTQNKSISDIVNEQYLNSLSIISDYQ